VVVDHDEEYKNVSFDKIPRPEAGVHKGRHRDRRERQHDQRWCCGTGADER
jgi:hypothetical protein